MSDNFRVIVLTSDKYLNAVNVFQYLFNKHWDSEQKVLVGGFTPPTFELEKNFEFHSIGKFADYPIGKWSDGLISLLESIEDDVIVFMLEDYWLVRDVNTQAVQMCVDYARQFKYVLRIDLTTDRLFAGGPQYPNDIPDYGHLGYLDLIKSDPASPYNMSLMCAVWRKDQLLKILVPNESPWDIEIAGTARLSWKDNRMLVLGTRQWLVRHTLGLRGGDLATLTFDGLDEDDKAECKKRMT